MEDETERAPTDLAAIAQKLGELAAHLRDLAQEPLADMRETVMPSEVAKDLVLGGAVVAPVGSS